jgi:hypothetical protein
MVSIFAIFILFVMLALAFIHIYWGHGRNWPGKNRQDLVDKVYGEGTQFPSIYACYAVAVTLTIAGLIPLFSVGVFSVSKLSSISWLNYLIAMPLLIRGLGGYLPVLEKKWTKVFVHYNRIIYNPLCIGLAISYAFFGSQ